jgi:hypothetical protein
LLGVAGVTTPVIGPRTFDQLEGLLDATGLELSDEDRHALEEPAPPPEVSPHRMLRGQIGQPDVPSLRRSGRANSSTTPPMEEKRPLRRQPDDHNFGSLVMLAVTAGGFLLITWIAAKALFFFLQ